MLDAFIIEELRRREEAEKRKQERPRLELPLYDGSKSYGPAPGEHGEQHQQDESDEVGRGEDQTGEDRAQRGVIVIEL